MQIVYSGVFLPLILCLALHALPSELMAQQRAPVPDAQAEQAAKKEAGEIYGGRFALAKTTAEKTALATEMIQASGKLQDGAPGQYVLLKIAVDIAAGAGDAPTALQAVEKLVERFDVPGAKLTAETLLAAARNATTSSQREAIGEAVLSIVDAVADADEYELALNLCESARASAQKTKQFALAKNLTAKIEAIGKRQKAFQEYRDAWAVLDTNPTDPAANLAAGRYLCFVTGDWDSGVPKLALGSDAALKDAAVKDLRGATTAEEQAAIGDAWWDLAETKQGTQRDTLRLRAGFWYRQAEPKLGGGLTGLKVRQRLAELSKLDAAVGDPDTARTAPSATPAGGKAKRDIRFTPKSVPRDFLLSDERVGQWGVRNGYLLMSNNPDATYVATYREYFKSMASVTIRGGLVPPNKHNFRVSVGPINIILNWEGGGENHFRGPTSETPTVSRPQVLVPGMIQEIQIRQDGEKIEVLIDGRPHFATKGGLEGTVSIYCNSGPITVQSLIIEGEVDGGKKVTGPSHQNLH
jgi:hypothetical protein